MLKTSKLLSISLLATTLSACSTLQFLKEINPLSALNSDNPESERLCANDDGSFYTCQDMVLQNIEMKPHPSLFSTDLHFNRLSEYTEQMVADLTRDIHGMQVDQPIVVASFIFLDSTLQTTDTLAIQIELLNPL